MRVWNVLKNDLARTVCSKAFVFAALGLTAATFLTGMDELSYMQSENDLIYIYGIFQYLDFQLLFLFHCLSSIIIDQFLYGFQTQI